jgi:hypothetical protein
MTSLGVVASAGLLSGASDISATSLLVGTQGVPLERLLQGIASGALGASAFKGGRPQQQDCFSTSSSRSLRQASSAGSAASYHPVRPPLLQWRLLRHRSSPVHEPRRGPALSCPKTRIFGQGLPPPTGRPHLLCRPTNLIYREQLLPIVLLKLPQSATAPPQPATSPQDNRPHSPSLLSR